MKQPAIIVTATFAFLDFENKDTNIKTIAGNKFRKIKYRLLDKTDS
ncbi:MAG: hypothetical protein ACFE9Z_17445 [Promethearchaeota archaeon]